MNSTLYFGMPLPAARSFIEGIDDRTGTVGTADTGIAPIVQRVVGYLVYQDIGPHLVTRPVR